MILTCPATHGCTIRRYQPQTTHTAEAKNGHSLHQHTEHSSIIINAPAAANARGFRNSTYCSSSYIIV
jgi:hypothetical protein